MNRAWMVAAAALSLGLGCAVPPESQQQIAIIGGTLLDGAGRPPLEDSVLVIAGGWVKAMGPRPTTPIPAGSEKVDARGKFVLPALVDPQGGGYSELQSEISRLLASGMAPVRILQKVSIDGARARGMEHEAGVLQPGRRADLWIVGVNPLDNLASFPRPERILFRGRWVSP